MEIQRPSNPARRKESKRWGDHPTAIDFTNYADTAWVDKYNAHMRSGNKIAAAGWLFFGGTRKSFMTRYDIVGHNTVAPRLTPGQEKTLRRFENVQRVVNFIFDKKQKEPLRHKLVRYAELYREGKRRRIEHRATGGGLINTVFPDRVVEQAQNSKLQRAYGEPAEVKPKISGIIDFEEVKKAGVDAVLKRYGPGREDMTPEEIKEREIVARAARQGNIKAQRSEHKNPLSKYTVDMTKIPAPAQPEPETTQVQEPQPKVLLSKSSTNGHAKSNGSNGKVPDWFLKGIKEQLQKRAAEDAEVKDAQNGLKIDNKGYIVIDAPVEDLDDEPVLGQSVNASIGEQEANHAAHKADTRTKTKGK